MIKFLHRSLPAALFISFSSSFVNASTLFSSGKVSFKSSRMSSSILVSFKDEGGMLRMTR